MSCSCVFRFFELTFILALVSFVHYCVASRVEGIVCWQSIFYGLMSKLIRLNAIWIRWVLCTYSNSEIGWTLFVVICCQLPLLVLPGLISIDWGNVKVHFSLFLWWLGFPCSYSFSSIILKKLCHFSNVYFVNSPHSDWGDRQCLACL